MYRLRGASPDPPELGPARAAVKAEAQARHRRAHGRLMENAAADGSVSFTQDVRHTVGLRPA